MKLVITTSRKCHVLKIEYFLMSIRPFFSRFYITSESEINNIDCRIGEVCIYVVFIHEFRVLCKNWIRNISTGFACCFFLFPLHDNVHVCLSVELTKNCCKSVKRLKKRENVSTYFARELLYRFLLKSFCRCVVWCSSFGVTLRRFGLADFEKFGCFESGRITNCKKTEINSWWLNFIEI